jgi:hypothetical protein
MKGTSTASANAEENGAPLWINCSTARTIKRAPRVQTKNQPAITNITLHGRVDMETDKEMNTNS